MQVRRQLIGISALAAASFAHGMEQVTLQLKWLHQFQFAGYYAAIEKGYYEEAGLEVQLLEAQPNQSPMVAVLNGQAEYGISTSDIVRLRSEGEPVVALAVIFQHSPLAIISSQHLGVETIHDLIGKKIMIQDGSADLLSLLKEEHVPLETIEFVKHDFSYQSLIDGKVHAFSGYITNEPVSLRAAGFEPLVFSPQTMGIDFYGDALFTTEAHIKKKPKQVEAFRQASLRGWDYATEHPEEIVDLILAKYSQRKSKSELMFEAQKSISLIRPELIELGHMNPKRWQHIAHILRNEEMLSGPVDIQGMLYTHKEQFPLIPVLQVLGISLFFIALLSYITGYQVKLRRKLQSEIDRRKLGDQTLIQREDEYRSLYENAPLAFIVWDLQLNIREWNHAAEALFGWEADEVIGRSASEFLVPERAHSQVEDGKAKLHKKTHHTQINENCTKDGRIIWCKWHNVTRRNSKGEAIEFHSIAVDASDEIAQQTRLIEERTQALDASEAKDILLARTSHEIRNPLNAIMGFTHLIHTDSKDEETREMARVILDGAEGMLQILNDLLDSAKIEAGKMALELKPIDLVQCVQKEAKLFSQLISEQGLFCKVTIGNNIPTIISDERRIQQILNNLINNARKFTSRGGIEILLFAQEPAHVTIQVKDTGIGMDQETLKKVFEPYVQGCSSTNRKYGGTGLGLSLTQKLVELLSGQINASSTLGKGSVFTLTLPITPPTPQAK